MGWGVCEFSLKSPVLNYNCGQSFSHQMPNHYIYHKCSTAREGIWCPFCIYFPTIRSKYRVLNMGKKS